MIKKLKITVLGETYDVTVEEIIDPSEVPTEAPAAEPAKATPVYADPKPVTEVKSPISGVVSSINVKVGDTVTNGDALCTVDVLKMENMIPSPIDGVVTGILVNTGDSVEPDTVLITLE